MITTARPPFGGEHHRSGRHRRRARRLLHARQRGAGGGTYTLWDPYPDRDASSTWAQAIDACAADLGITIERNSGNTGDTVKDLTTAASNLPDIAMVDNPKVSTLADAGLLTTAKENGLDVSDISPNILSAGEIDGDVYGVPVGANTLGLYYNPEVLEAAGVDIASVTDWASLTAALEQGRRRGQQGHHVLGRRNRGGDLPVPAVVLGRRSRPDGARLAGGRARPRRCGPAGCRTASRRTRCCRTRRARAGTSS